MCGTLMTLSSASLGNCGVRNQFSINWRISEGVEKRRVRIDEFFKKFGSKVVGSNNQKKPVIGGGSEVKELLFCFLKTRDI